MELQPSKPLATPKRPQPTGQTGGIPKIGAEQLSGAAITLTGDITGSGAGSIATTLSSNSVGNTKLRDSAALSVIGRSANTSGDPADIAAGSDGDILRRSGTTLGFGTILAASVSDLVEAAQDAVGDILADSSEINFTYDDATPSITASLVAGSIDESKLDASVNASLDLADSALQSETDPVFTASQAFNIDAGDITNLSNLSGTNTGDQVSGDFDHGGIQGLSDDDHTQYALLAGRATPQTLAFGTASGASTGYLTSTAHATKGKYFLNAAGTITVDELNGRLGIGTASPATKLEIVLSSEDGIDVSGTSVSPWNFDPVFNVSSPSGQAVRMVPQANLTENVSNVFNFNTNLWWGGSGSFTATNATGFFGRLSFQETTSDTITNAYGLRWDGILNQGSGSPSVGTQYGVHVDTRDFATTNWGLYVANRTNTNNYLGIGNTGIGATAWGTSAKGVLGIANGTAPSTSPADMIQIYSVDLSAGNATLGLRTETAVVSEAVTSDRTLSVLINGTVYKILLKS